MATRLNMTTFEGTSATALAMTVKQAFQNGPEVASPSTDASNDFVLLWGPPSAEKPEISEALGSIPSSVPFVAMSVREGFSNNRFYQDDGTDSDPNWRAVRFESVYNTVHSSYVPLPPTFLTIDNLKHVVNDLIKGFPAEIVSRYFSGRNPTALLGKGARGVVYRRPAILFVALPGMAGRSNEGKTLPWPAANMDHEIVDELGTRLAQNVSVFGGSIAGNWPPGESPGGWIGGKTLESEPQHSGRSIAALLIESDLRFGLSCSHGFTHVGNESAAISAAPSDVEAFPAPRVASGYPDCFHVVQLKEPCPDTTVLDNPENQQAIMAPLLSKDDNNPVAFFVQDESGEALLNPGYEHESGDNVRQFLRAVPPGGHMRIAETTWNATVNAARSVIENACELGGITNIAAAIVANCRGRLRLLSESNQDGHIDTAGPKAELDRMCNDGGKPIRVVGFYGDGETCSTSKGVPLHHNWSIACLVFGADLNPSFISAATRMAVATLGEKIAEGMTQQQLSEEIVYGAKTLLEVDDCHIRILDPVSMRLIRYAGVGKWSTEAAPCSIDVSPERPVVGITAHQAFVNRNTPVVRTGKEAVEIIGNNPADWGVGHQRALDLARQREWFYSIPIYDGAECLGVMSFASGSPDYFSTDELESAMTTMVERGSAELGANVHDDTLTRTGIRLLAAIQYANAVAIHIRNALVKAAESEVLRTAITTSSIRDVAEVIGKHAGALLGQRTYLTLMTPDEAGRILRAVAKQERFGRPLGPDDVQVELTAKDGSPQLGITGHVFRRGLPVFEDDVRNVDESKPYRYKNCIGSDIRANYVVPILDDGQRSIAVLNAEAPKGVLKRSRHEAVLHQLAGHCRVTMLRISRESESLKQQRKDKKRLANLERRHRERAGRSVYEWCWLIAHPTRFVLRLAAVLALACALMTMGFLGIDEIVSRQQHIMMLESAIEAQRERVIISGQRSPSAVGGETTSEMMAYIDELEREQERRLAQVTGTEPILRKRQTTHEDGSTRKGEESLVGVAPLRTGLFGSLSSGIVLVVTMLCWGVIGSLTWIIRMRDDERAWILRLALAGLFGGAFALLVVQGGKHIFLAQVKVGQVAFNPWTSAFLAFLAGVAAYRTNLLTSLIDQLIDAWGKISERSRKKSRKGK